MAYELRFISPAGREWLLMGRDPNGVFVNEGSLENQFIGSMQESSSTAVGSPGQMVSSQDSQFAPITGTLQCTVSAAYCGGRPVEEVWREYRYDWESTSPERPGQLVLDRDDGSGELILPARLNGALPGARVNPSELDEIPIPIPAVGDKGQWLLPRHGTGVVTVTNSGKGFIYPLIRWEKAGGTVTLPSEATFTLPPVTQPRTLNLDYARSFEVLDDAGTLDDTLWRTIRGQIIGEGIPVGESRTYHLPPDATLIWNLAFLDPWR